MFIKEFPLKSNKVYKQDLFENKARRNNLNGSCCSIWSVPILTQAAMYLPANVLYRILEAKGKAN